MASKEFTAPTSLNPLSGREEGIKAIIFDMDGVVIDSENVHKQTEIETLKHFGGDPTKVDWMAVKGIPLSGIFGKIIKDQELDVTWEEMAAYKLSLVAKTPPEEFTLFDGFEELVRSLQGRYQLALTTSAHENVVTLFFKQFNLDRYFDIVITASDITKGKPDPEPYLVTMEKLNCEPSECVVIEDALNGVRSAKAAGAVVIAVTHTFPRDRLEGADYIVDSLDEVKDLFENEEIT